MQILSINRSFPAANGYRILRPSDRSCWLLVSPCKRYRSMYWTRSDAARAAADRSSRKAGEVSLNG
jgi:hypothetical protein